MYEELIRQAHVQVNNGEFEAAIANYEAALKDKDIDDKAKDAAYYMLAYVNFKKHERNIDVAKKNILIASDYISKIKQFPHDLQAQLLPWEIVLLFLLVEYPEYIDKSFDIIHSGPKPVNDLLNKSEIKKNQSWLLDILIKIKMPNDVIAIVKSADWRSQENQFILIRALNAMDPVIGQPEFEFAKSVVNQGLFADYEIWVDNIFTKNLASTILMECENKGFTVNDLLPCLRNLGVSNLILERCRNVATLKLSEISHNLRFVLYTSIVPVKEFTRLSLADKIFIYFSIPMDPMVRDFMAKHDAKNLPLIESLCSGVTENQLAAKLATLESMSNAEIRNKLLVWRLHDIATHPDQFKLWANEIFKIQSIDIFPGGRPVRTWSKFVKDLAPVNLASLRFPTPFRTKKHKPENDPQVMTDLSGWRYKMLLGRTVILENEQGECRAFKFQKHDEENADILYKECEMTYQLKQKKLNGELKSNIPQPEGVFHLNAIEQWLVNANVPASDIEVLMATINKQDLNVYVYTTSNADYFTYLNDPKISDEDFARICEDIITDLYTLLQEGIVYNQLIEMFHSTNDYRDDLGRYQVLSDLLQDRLCSYGVVLGWIKSGAFPNLRLSGLADLGDFKTILEMQKTSCKAFNEPGELTSKSITSMFQKAYMQYPQKKADSYVLYNFIAEYQFVLHLISGARGVALAANAGPEELPLIWNKLAKLALDNASSAMAMLTNSRKEAALEYIACIVNVEQLAQQMKFWMTHEYLSHLQNNTIPTQIYGEDVTAKTDYHHLCSQRYSGRIFYDDVGFSRFRGKGSDLGVMLGVNPITEFEKLMYGMISYIHILNQQHQDLDSLKKALANALRNKDYQAALSNVHVQQELFSVNNPYGRILANIERFVSKELGMAAPRPSQ